MSGWRVMHAATLGCVTFLLQSPSLGRVGPICASPPCTSWLYRQTNLGSWQDRARQDAPVTVCSAAARFSGHNTLLSCRVQGCL